MTARISFISHAATPALRRAAFPLDESLEDRAIARIRALQWKAPRAERILAAPERRARETAQALGLSTSIEPTLRDCDYGTWRGRELAELQQADPESLAAWLTDPAATSHGGESIVVLMDRIGRWLDSQSGEGHTIAVTHPGVIRCAIVHALSSPLEAFWRVDISALSLTDLRFNGRSWTVRCTACPLDRISS